MDKADIKSSSAFVRSGTAGTVKQGVAPFWMWLAPLLAMACAGAFFITMYRADVASREDAPGIISPGMPAPDFKLSAQDGRNFHLADYKGRAVFLAFVPSWSDDSSVAEAKSFQATMKQYEQSGAKVFLISCGAKDQAQALHDSENLPFPLLIDTDGSFVKQYGLPRVNYRTTFVVEPGGKVKFRLSDTTIDAPRHGEQLLKVSKCCMDEVLAARAHGIGKPVGDFSLPRAGEAGKMETVFGDSKQKATVALFLSTKCPCSNGYNERLLRLTQEFADKPVRFIAIYSNADETAPEIAKHAVQNHFPFPAMKDDHLLGADHFQAQVTPEVFVLDDAKVLRYAGRIDDSREPAQATTTDLKDAITAVLEGREPSHKDTRAFGCSIVRSDN